MAADDSRGEAYQQQAARLLARGGRVLGLSAVAGARGQRSGQGPWYVLDSHTTGAADEILSVLEQEVEPELLEAAVGAAMEQGPATASPSWCARLRRDPEMIDRLGRELVDRVPREILGRKDRIGDDQAPSDRDWGLAGLATALSRSLDSLRSLALQLPGEDADTLIRMGHLAQVLVDPGEPTRMRALLRELMEREECDG